MKVFLSWSGELSHKIAIELRDWLPLVIQSLQPYVSSEDIDKGTRWSMNIAKELEDSSFGILCVTPQNLEAPWIHFEAGALLKAFNNAHVSPILFGLKPSDLINNPLLQFQSTRYEKKDFLKLIISINNAFEYDKLDEPKLQKTFDKWWDGLKEKLDPFLDVSKHDDETMGKSSVIETHQNQVLEEILELNREQLKLLRNPEAILPINYFNYIIKNQNIGIEEEVKVYEIEKGLNSLQHLINTSAETPYNPEQVEKELQMLQMNFCYLMDYFKRGRPRGLFKKDR